MLAPMRLLLVEDDPMIGEAVQDLLRAEHYAVDWARDGDAADTALRTQTYDLVLLDIGLQAAMVSNQSRVYGLDASARSRLNTVYMTMMFAAGALGSAVGAKAFSLFGWTGVCGLGVVCGLGALGVELWPVRDAGGPAT